MIKKVCVTGANGYIGSYVCAELVQRGYEVIAAVRDPRKASHLKGVTVAHGDLKSRDWPFEGCDPTLHPNPS